MTAPVLPAGWRGWSAAEQTALLEVLQAASVKADPFTHLGYTPEPRQQLLHDATEHDVLYGGAAGGGKTKALVAEALRVAVKYPGIRVGAFRRSYDELSESLLKELASFSFGAELGGSWNGGERQLSFPNGSIIRFRYAESPVDATRRQGGEYQMIIIDERGLVDPSVVDLLQERLRSGNDRIPVLGIRSSTNPGGPGHGRLKQRFIDATDYGAKVIIDSAGQSVRFIPARVSDNPHVDAGYLQVLASIPDEARRKAMMDGDWDTFAGQYFDEWNRDVHVVAPFQIPAEWRRTTAVDYGYAAPWCCLWGAVDQDGRLWVYRETYETQVGEQEQAHTILDCEGGERIAHRVGDPSMWAKVGSAPSVAKAYATAGVRMSPAQNDRVLGWQRLHSYLGDYPACPIHRDQGLEVCPRLHVFENCTNLIRTLPALPRDPRKPEDADTKAEDHAPDALRYLVMSIAVPRDAAIWRPQQRVPTGLDATVGARPARMQAGGPFRP